MEKEITVAQLRQCGLPITLPSSLSEFTPTILYKLLVTALSHLNNNNNSSEEDNELELPTTDFLNETTSINTNTTKRLHQLSALTAQLQSAGCEFIQQEYLMYPTIESTKKLMTWLINELHRAAMAKSNVDNNDKEEEEEEKKENIPMIKALHLFHSHIQQCDKGIGKQNYNNNESLLPIQSPFFTVGVITGKEENNVHNPTYWSQIHAAYKVMQKFSSPEQKYILSKFNLNLVRKPYLSEVLLQSFQEINATERTSAKDIFFSSQSPVNHRLMITREIEKSLQQGVGYHKTSLKPTLNDKHISSKTKSTNIETNIRKTNLSADAFFYNPSEDGITVDNITQTLPSAKRTAELKDIQTLQKAIEKTELNIKNSETQMADNEAKIIEEYMESKKEVRQLTSMLNELETQKSNYEEEMQILAFNNEEQQENRKRQKEEAQRLEYVLSLMDTPEISETQISNEITELTSEQKNYRNEIQNKLQKVGKKREELLEELRAAGGDHEERLAQIRRSIKEVEKEIKEKKKDVKTWEADVSVHTDDIDRLHFLHYIYDMTSNICKQQTQIASIARETTKSNERIKELENRLKLLFSKREDELFQKASSSEGGNLFNQLHKSFLEVRESYIALIRTITERGELHLELYSMENRLEKLISEVESYDTKKIENDLKELQNEISSLRES